MNKDCRRFRILNKRRRLAADEQETEWGSGTVDRYQIVSQVGEGTYGQVYKAEDRQSGPFLFFFAPGSRVELLVFSYCLPPLFRSDGGVEEGPSREREGGLPHHGCERVEDSPPTQPLQCDSSTRHCHRQTVGRRLPQGPRSLFSLRFTHLSRNHSCLAPTALTNKSFSWCPLDFIRPKPNVVIFSFCVEFLRRTSRISVN